MWCQSLNKVLRQHPSLASSHRHNCPCTSCAHPPLALSNRAMLVLLLDHDKSMQFSGFCLMNPRAYSAEHTRYNSSC